MEDIDEQIEADESPDLEEELLSRLTPTVFKKGAE